MKMRLRFICVLFCIAGSAVQLFAQQPVTRIWNGLAPGTEDMKNEEKRDDGLIYKVYQPDVEIFLPSHPDQHHLAVVVLPGGGYTLLAYVKEGTKIAGWLNDNGVAAFVLKYRLNPDEALQDAQRAVSFVRSKSNEYSIDPKRVGVLGFSAGGQVAANLSTHFTRTSMRDAVDSVDCRPDFMVLVYPALDWLHMAAGDTGKKDGFVQFYKLVNANTPPTFIAHAGDDQTVPVQQSIDFFEALHAGGVPCEMHIYEQGGHGFGLEEDRGEVVSWGDLCVKWMRVRGILSGK